MKNQLAALIALLLLTSCGQLQTTDSVETAAAPGAIYEIEQMVGNLYRARSNNHYTVFLVAYDGVVLADPLNLAFAEWLKAEIDERFGKEVKYVLYSHHHWDHASGGAVFADTAEFIGHENMLTGLELPLPANYLPADRNDDGVLQRNEAGGGALASFDFLDENNDGAITGAEMNRDIIPPTITYSDSYPVYISGWVITMIHAGNNHSDDGSIINFGEEATAYGVDWLNIRRLPNGLSGQPVQSWLETIDRMANLPITHVVPGHGERGRLEDLLEYRQFFVDLDTAAREAIDAGVSLEEFQDNISLEAYSDWDRYDSHLRANAADFYRMAMQD